MLLAAFILSLGAVNALIPLLIVLVLIVAAAGSTRGYSIFNFFGIATLAGVNPGGKSSVAGKSGFPVVFYYLQNRPGSTFRIGSRIRGRIMKRSKARLHLNKTTKLLLAEGARREAEKKTGGKVAPAIGNKKENTPASKGVAVNAPAIGKSQKVRKFVSAVRRETYVGFHTKQGREHVPALARFSLKKGSERKIPVPLPSAAFLRKVLKMPKKSDKNRLRNYFPKAAALLGVGRFEARKAYRSTDAYKKYKSDMEAFKDKSLKRSAEHYEGLEGVKLGAPSKPQKPAKGEYSYRERVANVKKSEYTTGEKITRITGARYFKAATLLLGPVGYAVSNVATGKLSKSNEAEKAIKKLLADETKAAPLLNILDRHEGRLPNSGGNGPKISYREFRDEVRSAIENNPKMGLASNVKGPSWSSAALFALTGREKQGSRQGWFSFDRLESLGAPGGKVKRRDQIINDMMEQKEKNLRERDGNLKTRLTDSQRAELADYKLQAEQDARKQVRGEAFGKFKEAWVQTPHFKAIHIAKGIATGEGLEIRAQNRNLTNKDDIITNSVSHRLREGLYSDSYYEHISGQMEGLQANLSRIEAARKAGTGGSIEGGAATVGEEKLKLTLPNGKVIMLSESNAKKILDSFYVKDENGNKIERAAKATRHRRWERRNQGEEEDEEA